MSDNLFLPETPPPPVAPKPEPVIEPLPVAAPSDEKNLTVPFALFAHPPADLEESLEEAGCFSTHHYAIMQKLFACVDFNETVRVEGMDLPTGWTRTISYDVLAKKTGMSRRHAIRCVKDFIDAKLLEKQGVPMQNVNWSVNRFRITIYDSAIAAIIDEPDHPKRKITTLVAPAESIENQRSEMIGESESQGSDSGIQSSDYEAPFLESKDLRGPRLTVSDCPGPNEESENRGDSLIEEKQETTDLTPASEEDLEQGRAELAAMKAKAEAAEEEKASLGKKNDVVPSKQIGEVLDSLTQAKGMDASPTDDSVEAIITAFNPQSPAISNWKHAQVASVLKGHLEGVLRAASIDMPPILFFKYCLREMDNRLADGKIDTRPSSLNYFLNAATGKDIVVCALDNLKSERTAEKTVQKTDDFLQGERDRSATERKIPAAAKAELDRILGRS